MVRDSVTSPWRMEARTEVTDELPRPGRPTTLPGDGVREAATGARAAWAAFLERGTEDGLRVDEASRAWRRAMADLGSRAIFRGWEVGARAEDARRCGRGRRGRPPRPGGAAGRHAAAGSSGPGGAVEPAVRPAPRRGGGVLVVDELAVGLVHLPDEGPPTLLGTTFSEIPAGAP